MLTLILLAFSGQDATGFVGDLNAARRGQSLPAVRHSRPGDDVARRALRRLAVTGERLPYVEGHAIVYATGLPEPRDALAAWRAIHVPRAGLFDPETREVGFARLGTGHAAAYRRDPEPAAVAAQPVAMGDAYGFLGWLNGTRAAYGLPAVGYDPNLEAWASQNNQMQAAYGMNHHVMGPARRQNVGAGSLLQIQASWMASPAHASALLDPTLQWIGIAGLGAYWTFNGN